MKYILRFDDVHPKMDSDKFRKAIEILEHNKVKGVLCIIPKNEDKKLNKSKKDNPNFKKEVDRLIKKGWEIAMHGVTHTNNRGGGLLKINEYGEFPGLPKEDQYDLIKKGKELMIRNDWDTFNFVAPAHAFDENTLLALFKNEFINNLDAIGIYPTVHDLLLHIPCIWWQFKEIPVPFRWLNGVTQIAIHTDELEDNDFLKLERFVKSKKDKFTSIDEVSNAFYSNRKTFDIVWQSLINITIKLAFYLVYGIKKRIY